MRPPSTAEGAPRRYRCGDAASRVPTLMGRGPELFRTPRESTTRGLHGAQVGGGCAVRWHLLPARHGPRHAAALQRALGPSFAAVSVCPSPLVSHGPRGVFRKCMPDAQFFLRMLHPQLMVCSREKELSDYLNGSHPLPSAVSGVVPVPAWPNGGPSVGAGAIAYSVGEFGGTGVSQDYTSS